MKKHRKKSDNNVNWSRSQLKSISWSRSIWFRARSWKHGLKQNHGIIRDLGQSHGHGHSLNKREKNEKTQKKTGKKDKLVKITIYIIFNRK